MTAPPAPTDGFDLRCHPQRVPLRVRAAMRARALGHLLRDASDLAADQGLWWLVPAMIVLVIGALAVASAHTAVPVVVYTLV